MKISTIIALSTISASSAFSVSKNNNSNQNHHPSVVQKIAGAAATIATALTISANAATASMPVSSIQTDFISTSASTSILLSKDMGDPMTLPSYDTLKKNSVAEFDVESVNKKTMQQSRAMRDDKNVNKENNQRYIELRKDEDEEDKRMTRMKEYAKQEREEQLKKEKAESAANRWNTF
jgi:hypothetical protein